MSNKTNNSTFDKFTNKYSLSKTLRFELVPHSETKKHLNQFIESDTKRDKNYQELKKIIDKYHKDHIEKSLTFNKSQVCFKKEDLEMFNNLSNKLQSHTTEKEQIKKELDQLYGRLRKQVTNQFKNSDQILKQQVKSFKKEYSKDKKIPILNQNNKKTKDKDLEVVKSFDKFTTYLDGFHKNRKNMYSDKDQSTAIAYRIVHENLPRFLNNIGLYHKISKKFSSLKQEIDNIGKNFEKELDYFGVKEIKEVFTFEFFNKCLNQTGIDHYNTLIGGKNAGEQKKPRGINEKINNLSPKKHDKINKKPPVMQPLYKQILSDRESHSYYYDEFNSRKEVLDAIHRFWQESVLKTEVQKSHLLYALQNLLTKNLPQYDFKKIYFKSSSLASFSNKVFKDYNLIKLALKDKNSTEKNITKQEQKWLKKDFFSFYEINQALLKYAETNDEVADWFQKIYPQVKQATSDAYMPATQERDVLTYYFKDQLLHWSKNHLPPVDRAKDIEKLYKKIEGIPVKNRNNEFSEQEVGYIYDFLQNLMDILHLARPVHIDISRNYGDLEKDTNFYNEFDPLYKKLSSVIELFNKSRNYITKNTARLQKIKINFDNPQFLGGWDVNKEKDRLAVLFRKKQNNKYIYYLGVMHKDHKNILDYHLSFDDHSKKTIKEKKQKLKNTIMATEGNEEYYEKINYKQIAKPFRDIHTLIEIDGKVCRKTKYLDRLKKEYFPYEIWKIASNQSYKSGDRFNHKDLEKFINYYKKIAPKYWKEFDLNLKNSNEYKNFKEFTDHIAVQGYKLSFDKIKSSYIEQKIKDGHLYLFKIHNKDFSKYSTGQPNLHTSYFRLLFDPSNLKDVVLKLNGQAEVFYRKATKKRKVTHPKNTPIRTKNPLNSKISQFKYDLVKDKRFTEDKYFFHVPVSLNFKEHSLNGGTFNQQVRDFLQHNKNINIIGIDRGERHLAYYAVLNQDRQILEQGSFNTIKNSYTNKKHKPEKIEVKINYHNLLEKRTKERDEARKSWTKIENIKELKSGYLSHLVHQIAQLVIKYNAIVVFEDLSHGFKRGRMKFEKQIYQKLEKALIDKLNYLVFKDRSDPKTPGGYLKAYQLTAPFESFKKMSKQTGVIFYTSAYYTSKVDPKTGFINLIYPKYESVEKSQTFFKRFEKIYFDKNKGCFIFKYYDAKVNPDKKLESQSVWQVYTYGTDRYKYDFKNKNYKKINITENIKKLFGKYKINYLRGCDLKESIIDQNQKDFFKALTEYLHLTLQLRHINPKASEDSEKDFILSPVCDKSGRFFDSRQAGENEPKNADANGAYHIALKGSLILDKINKWEAKKNLNLGIKNKEWFSFLKNKKPL